MLHKLFTCQTKAERGESGPTRFTTRSSGPAQDRDGEFLEPLGCELDPGAPLLYGHNYSEARANIGLVEEAETSADHVINRGVFDDDIPQHTDAIILAEKARKGRLQKQSVGFIPKVVQRPSGEVITLAPGQWIYTEPGTRYLKWLQVELSFVPVGSYPDTELLAARGFGAPEGKGLRELMRRVLEELAVDDEFLDRLKTARERVKTSAGATPANQPGAQTPPAGAPAASGEAASAGTQALEDEIDALLSGEEPERIANESEDPERLAAAIAAGARATTDIDELFDMDAEAETSGAGAQGSAQT